MLILHKILLKYFMQILKTKRLTLRTTSLNDANDLYTQIFSNPDVVKYTFGSELFNLKQTKEFIKNNCNFDSKLGLSTLIENESSKIIGLAGVIECDYLDTTEYEFGFILGENFWAKGYATEIGQAQIDFIKDNIKAPRVLALAHKNNLGSLNCIKKLGLTYLKTIPTDGRGDREVYAKEF